MYVFDIVWFFCLVCQFRLQKKFFNKACRVLVAKLHDRYIYLPYTDAEWEAEVCGFLEN